MQQNLKHTVKMQEPNMNLKKKRTGRGQRKWLRWMAVEQGQAPDLRVPNLE